jgi:rhamnosyltransferase
MRIKKPLVSVIIRTKNEAKFIGRVLKCLYDQTFKNFEVIVIDSGSSDKTVEIVKKFPIELIQIKPEEFGYSSTLNLGINKARGEFICIMSGHSIPFSNRWLSSGVAVLREKDVAGVSGNYSDFILGYAWLPFAKFALSLQKFNEPTRNDYNPWFTNTNSLIKRSCWEKYHFDEKLKYCEDYDWAKEMLSRGFNIVKLRDFSVFHSHLLLGRPVYWQMVPTWKKWEKIIEKKKRPIDQKPR